jgi:hypothetical protein
MQCDFWLDVAKALIGTFVGAGLAFGANLYVQYLQRRAANLAAGIVATAILSQQLGDFRTVQKAVSEELAGRDRLALWIRIRPLTMVFDEALRFDFEKLGFLARLGAPLLAELALAQRRYLSLAYVVEEHRATAKEIQRRLAGVGITAPITADTGPIRDTVGQDLVRRQEDFAKLIMEHCEKDERMYLDLASRLHNKLRKIFGYRFWFRKVSIIQIEAKNPLENEQQGRVRPA